MSQVSGGEPAFPCGPCSGPPPDPCIEFMSHDYIELVFSGILGCEGCEQISEFSTVTGYSGLNSIFVLPKVEIDEIFYYQLFLPGFLTETTYFDEGCSGDSENFPREVELFVSCLDGMATITIRALNVIIFTSTAPTDSESFPSTLGEACSHLGFQVTTGASATISFP